MTKKRPPIPKGILDDLLVRCRHSCCICETFGVSVHHIDGNPENNEEDNLIPVCGTCAERAHIKYPAATRIHGISEDQLKLYKKNWIAKCASNIPSLTLEVHDIKETMLQIKGSIEKLQERQA